MLSLRIEGSVAVAESQDEYKTLHVRFSRFDDGTPVMETAWEPTPNELAVLVAGGSIRLMILGTQHPPILLGVAAAPSVFTT